MSNIPHYRRPAFLDEAMTAWLKQRQGGPCGVCGSATPRGSDLGWSIVEDLTLCAPCAPRVPVRWGLRDGAPTSSRRPSESAGCPSPEPATALLLAPLPTSPSDLPFAHLTPEARIALRADVLPQAIHTVRVPGPQRTRITGIAPMIFPEYDAGLPAVVDVGTGAETLTNLHQQQDRRAEREREEEARRHANMLRRKAEIDADPNAAPEDRAWAAFDPATYAPVAGVVRPNVNTAAEHIANRIRAGKDPEAERIIDQRFARKRAGAR